MLSDPQTAEMRRSLLVWFSHYQRDLPWRKTKDPYSIWVSETMLQQTRVAAVLPYYKRFLESFPDFHTLASAPESDVLAKWAGLGYYYRARNLQKAAQSMRDAGQFPTEYEAIRQLPGVGDYTAAAVASIAFDLPHAVLDGNVLRVVARLFADPADISSGKGRKHFAVLADALLDRQQPGAFNQAVMELGATLCLPRNPQCLLCPVSAYCEAKQKGAQMLFPVKQSKQVSIKQERTLFWIEREGSVLGWQRPADLRLMPGFWELPERAQLPSAIYGEELGSFRHGITVHSYTFTIVRSVLPAEPGICQWLPLDSIKTLPVSTVFKKAIKAVQKTQKIAAAAVP